MNRHRWTNVSYRLRIPFLQGDYLTMTGNTLWTRYFGTLFVVGALGVATLQAQQALPTPPLSDGADMPPEISFVLPDSATPPGTDARNIVVPESVGAGELLGPVRSPFDDCNCDDDDYRLWDGLPAVTESSGTWLQRGFWYSEIDALVMNRFWSRTDALFAADLNPTVPAINFVTNRFLIIKGAHPGQDAGVRFMLGRFLFRDEDNRDHSAEFTAFGGGDWVTDVSIQSSQPNSIIVPFLRDGNNPSFQFSNAMRLTYSSRFNSFEANYRVQRRMDKDQMILKPTGEWVRRATRTMTREFLIGLRFFELSERVFWTAEDTIVQMADEDGEYLLETNNDLFGFQIGGGHAYETSRWSLNALGKAGVYVNNATGDSSYSVTSNNNDNSDLAFNNRAAENQLSFIGDFRLTGRWHLTPNFSLRAGYELLYVTSVALATHQVNFIPGYNVLATSGDPFYHGASFGLECYW